MSVYTTDKPGAGTDANVSVILRGEKGASGKQTLSKGPTDFERGGKDTFVVGSEDLGEVKEVVIGHDNHGTRPSWHLDQVMITINKEYRSWWGVRTLLGR